MRLRLTRCRCDDLVKGEESEGCKDIMEERFLGHHDNKSFSVMKYLSVISKRP